MRPLLLLVRNIRWSLGKRVLGFRVRSRVVYAPQLQASRHQDNPAALVDRHPAHQATRSSAGVVGPATLGPVPEPPAVRLRMVVLVDPGEARCSRPRPGARLAVGAAAAA